MNGTPFKLGTFTKAGVRPFAAIVLGDDDVIDLKAAPNAGSFEQHRQHPRPVGRLGCQFRRAAGDCAALEKEGRPGAVKLASLRALPPVGRPGKMFYAAQNFQEHVDEMLRAGMTPKAGPEIHRREIDHASPICSSRRRAASPAPTTTSQSRAA